MGMKIISYNVNGLRSAISKGFMQWLEQSGADLVCLQETKIQEDQVDKLSFEYLGYHSYWHSAEKKGYSGVAILSRINPERVVVGMERKEYDLEGRVIRMDLGDLTILNVYFPSGTTGDTRQVFKMKFLEDLMVFVNSLREERPKLLLCGDYNIAHKPVDINHPERHKNSSGFLPEEREWLDRFVASGFIDTFREFNTQKDQYSWWSYRAGSRAKNLGWRIDYHMVTSEMKPMLLDAGIMNEVVHSDHCPVWVELNRTAR